MIKLVEQAQKGDENAYLKLFQLYKKEIYQTAFIYVKKEEDALDVVQETAFHSFKSIKTLKDPKYFKTWLMRITITCSIDLLRQRKKVIHLDHCITEEIINDEDKNVPQYFNLR
ncbi:sigma factor [Cytobacillus sp. Hm23]